MLRLRRKRQETVARLRKITFEGRQNNSQAGKLKEGSTQEGVDFTTNNYLTSVDRSLSTTNGSENYGSLGYINLETEEAMTNNYLKENNETKYKVDLKTLQENTNNNSIRPSQQDLTFPYSLTNLPSFQRTLLPKDFSFFLILVYPRQIRCYKVNNKQTRLQGVHNTRYYQNKKNNKGAVRLFLSSNAYSTPKSQYGTDYFSINKRLNTTTRNLSTNALPDLWSHDSYMGTICGQTRLHSNWIFYYMDFPFTIRRLQEYPEFTHYQVYHRPFVITLMSLKLYNRNLFSFIQTIYRSEERR